MISRIDPPHSLMPCTRGYEQTEDGWRGYYQWGSEGKKYYYKPTNEEERQEALEKCKAQGRAIKANQSS